MNLPLRIAAVVGLMALASPVLAHHSYSMFDRARTDTVAGTVKAFEMINPHGWLTVVAPDPKGIAREWAFETGGPGQMQRAGWTPGTLSPGDKVRVTIHPMRDGSYSGQVVAVVLPDGRTLRGFPGV